MSFARALQGTERWDARKQLSRQPIQQTFQSSGGGIAWYEWGSRSGPTVLLLHATGFHARCWDKVIDALVEDTHVIAVDLRCHGRSEETGHLTDWTAQAHDIVELVEGLDLNDIVGVGHSMGGFCMAYTAGHCPQRFKNLLLIDPVMHPPDYYEAFTGHEIAHPKDHPVARRRNKWASPEHMFEHFKNRSPYSLWQPDVLKDYCDHGLLPAEEGEHLRLACPPESEASVYLGSLNESIYHLARDVHVPVTVLRAKGPEPGKERILDFTISPTWEGVAAQFPKGRDVHLPDLSHFIPMQDPVLVAQFITEKVND